MRAVSWARIASEVELRAAARSARPEYRLNDGLRGFRAASQVFNQCSTAELVVCVTTMPRPAPTEQIVS
jgi:hypothetical protein